MSFPLKERLEEMNIPFSLAGSQLGGGGQITSSQSSQILSGNKLLI